jgi:hypothetical protein
LTDVANEEHVARLKEGVDAWNAWRKTSATSPNLSNANLGDIDLRGVNLNGANLTGSHLNGTDLRKADLSNTDLSYARLTGTSLRRAKLPSALLDGAFFVDADLTNVDLSKASLFDATFINVMLDDANLTDAAFGSVDLNAVIGLETCRLSPGGGNSASLWLLVIITLTNFGMYWRSDNSISLGKTGTPSGQLIETGHLGLVKRKEEKNAESKSQDRFTPVLSRSHRRTAPDRRAVFLSAVGLPC